MKNFSAFFLVFLLIGFSCSKKADDHQHDVGEAIESSGNEALYQEVMKVHDEVMKKMDEIYRQKEKLKDQIANTPDMTESRKVEIESVITQLDSANQGMMDWMHEFKPLPDSTGEEKAREYLENEMQRIKKVGQDIEEALSKASATN